MKSKKESAEKCNKPEKYLLESGVCLKQSISSDNCGIDGKKCKLIK
jgi:hypothetical protein